MAARALPLLLLLLLPTALAAQRADRVQVFLDCSGFHCDRDYYQTEIGFVRWVRDRQDADVHLLVTRQRTGGGGTEYTVEMVGQREFAGLDPTLRFAAPADATDEQRRSGLARTLRLGLAPFAAATGAAPGLDVVWEEPEAGGAAGAPADDPWNFWTFETGFSGSFSGESQRSSYSVSGSAEAERVTPQWKIELDARGRVQRRRFEIDDSTTIRSDEHSYGTDALLVRSLGAHWSAGVRADAESSTFLNQDLALRLAPALEWSYFPYDQFNRRQLTLLYSLGAAHFDYVERTIFDRTSQTLGNHRLEARLELNQLWGEADIGLEGRQFLHDPSRFRLVLDTGLEVRLLRGLSVNVFGGASYIRDQLFLPAGGATPEEVLLRLRQLQTNYEYYLSGGLSYTFGSIYSAVVNPRFE